MPKSERQRKRKRVYILASIIIDKRSIKATEKKREKEKKIEFKQKKRKLKRKWISWSIYKLSDVRIWL